MTPVKLKTGVLYFYQMKVTTLDEEKTYHRILFLFGTCFFLLLVAALRLFQIQVINFSKFAKLAGDQHGLVLQENQLRGSIYDRNGRMLRSSVQKWYLLVKSINSKLLDEYKDRLAFLAPDFFVEAKANLSKSYWVYSKPLSQSEINRILHLGIPDLKIIANQTGRDKSEKLAWHILGMIVDQKAESGMELTLEPALKQPSFSASIKSLADATHQPLPGLGLRSVQYRNPNGYYLTIDLPIQTVVENVLDRKKICGAVVVLEVSSGDILALASRPMVNLTDLKASLTDPEYPFINRAVTAYPPGSVFKTALLCAGLDSGLVFEDEFFKDQGYFQLGDKRWNCTTSDEGGHGFISLTEAFAYSCNPVFIELALRLNPGLITDYAENFGFGRPVNIGLSDEAWGELPTGIGLSLGERANLALGQQLVSVTPLQVASLIQTIANEGVRLTPRLLKGKTTENGEMIEFSLAEPANRVIKKGTARQVQKMMAAVLEYGTGREAQPSCKAAGKTGTVQNIVGQDLPDHAWFAGYAPLCAPRYAIVVFCEKGISGGETAAPIFRKIVDKITSRLD